MLYMDVYAVVCQTTGQDRIDRQPIETLLPCALAYTRGLQDHTRSSHSELWYRTNHFWHLIRTAAKSPASTPGRTTAVQFKGTVLYEHAATLLQPSMSAGNAERT